jgi:hypothetical protein
MTMDLTVWRDISLIWLLFLTLLAVLPFGVLFFFAIKGMHRLRQLAKQYLPLAQEKARLVSDQTEKISQKVVSPIIGAHARAAQANRVTEAILTRRKNA